MDITSRRTYRVFQLLIVLSLGNSLGTIQTCQSEEILPTYVIAFGSCNRQNKPQIHWETIRASNPDLFLWTGDSVYPKDNSVLGLESAFKNLTENVLYKQFKEEVTVDGIWDDHDMGVNDGGKHVTIRGERQELFGRYIGSMKSNSSTSSSTSTSSSEEGRGKESRGDKVDTLNSNHNYRSKSNDLIDPAGMYKIIDRKFMGGPHIRFILLDTRSHRDFHYIRSVGEVNLPFTPLFAALIRGVYSVMGVGRKHGGDVLGEDQWLWLEQVLHNSPADFHAIISSIQILTTNPVVESWGHFPEAKRRLFELLKKEDPSGLFFMSGDVHHGELSQAVIERGNNEDKGDKGDNEGVRAVEKDRNVKREEEMVGVDGNMHADNKNDMKNNMKKDSEKDNKRHSDGDKKAIKSGDEEQEVWVEVTSSGLTHTCGDSSVNKILCPAMLKMFADHRLPVIDSPKGPKKEERNNVVPPLNGEGSEQFLSPIKPKALAKENKEENIFVGLNFGLITDISPSSSLSPSSSSSSSSSISSTSASSTPSSFALNVSVISLATRQPVLTHIVRSNPRETECKIRRINDVENTDLDEYPCKQPISRVVTAAFPLFIPIKAADNLHDIIMMLFLTLTLCVLAYANSKILFRPLFHK